MIDEAPIANLTDGEAYQAHFDEAAREEAGQAAEAPQNADDRHGHEVGTGPEDPGQPPSGERHDPDAARPAGSESDDAWKDAPAHLREAYEALRRERERDQNLIKSNQGRWSQAQRELAELRSRGSAPAQPQAEKPQSKAESGERAERLAKVKGEYPDIAEPFIEEIADLRSKLEAIEQSASRRDELETAQARLDLKESYAREEQALAEAHPDWNDVVRTETFVAWASAQPRMVQEALQRNGTTAGIVDGTESAKILSDFKRDTTPAPDPLAARRESQLEGSRNIPPRAPALEARPLGGGSHEEEFELARQEEARAARR